MATKNFMTLENLTTYDGLIKQYIADGDAESIKAVALDNNILKFYDVETPTVQTQPKYSIELPNPDMSDLMHKIANATGDRVVVSNSDGSVSEGLTIGDENSGADPTIITGYFSETPENGEIMIWSPSNGGLIHGGGVNIDDIVTGSGSVGYLTVWGEDGITQAGLSVDNLVSIGANDSLKTGYLVAGSNDAHDVDDAGIRVEDVKDVIDATAGFDGTNTIAGFIGSIPQGSSASTVVGYVDEVAGSITSASNVTLVEAQTPTTGYLKTYELYQGGNAAANLVGKIDIPKDLVVTSGEIVVNPTGQPAGTYLKLTIANQTTPVYINVADLCDAYTAASGATQVQLAISNTNEISATLVAGGVGTTELANSAVTEGKIANNSVTTAKINNSAVTTDKIADDAVTAAKVNISEHTESYDGSYSDSCGISVSVSTTDAQVSDVSVGVHSGYLYANISDSVDTTISNALGELDADETQPAGADGLSLEVVQTDGLITSVTGSIAANTYDSYGAASTVQSTVVGVLGDAPTASTIYGAKAYADSATAAISTADINALFSSNSNS